MGLSSFMSVRLYTFGAMLLAAGAFHTYDQYDKSNNYSEVQARVRSVTDQCYMEKTQGDRTSTSDVLPCAQADFMVKNHPAWQGFDVKHNISLAFYFVSPVDGKQHDSTMKVKAYPGGKELHSGDVFRVLAHKREPEKTRAL